METDTLVDNDGDSSAAYPGGTENRTSRRSGVKRPTVTHYVLLAPGQAALLLKMVKTQVPISTVESVFGVVLQSLHDLNLFNTIEVFGKQLGEPANKIYFKLACEVANRIYFGLYTRNSRAPRVGEVVAKNGHGKPQLKSGTYMYHLNQIKEGKKGHIYTPPADADAEAPAPKRTRRATATVVSRQPAPAPAAAAPNPLDLRPAVEPEEYTATMSYRITSNAALRLLDIAYGKYRYALETDELRELLKNLKDTRLGIPPFLIDTESDIRFNPEAVYKIRFYPWNGAPHVARFDPILQNTTPQQWYWDLHRIANADGEVQNERATDKASPAAGEALAADPIPVVEMTTPSSPEKDLVEGILIALIEQNPGFSKEAILAALGDTDMLLLIGQLQVLCCEQREEIRRLRALEVKQRKDQDALSDGMAQLVLLVHAHIDHQRVLSSNVAVLELITQRLNGNDGGSDE